MRINTLKPVNIGFLLYAVCLIPLIVSCLNTRNLKDPDAGPNLGFEFEKEGIPSNWIFYEPPGIDCKITCDSIQPKEGEQSLRIDLRNLSDTGHINYSGLTKEFPELGTGRFRVSCWIKNKGVCYELRAVGVSAKKSATNPVVRCDSSETPNWKFMELQAEIPEGMWPRFETRLKGEGSFWMDGVEIRKE